MELSADQFKHESWVSMIGMGAGYVAILALILVVLFLIPYAVMVLL
ncbi:hypothetical protein HTSR_0980 [Halodesulfurarchaeum formicicum]|uniref:Uncharacterized protein n=1 Tax=Halodesulfurarchaeum formicicum TaxID=1873524 RepID=A0A1D8S488_9EURY|nr:hypothetical protein [Halodesulfurarchaeum formicicum]AOW80164.1 hypothetical protein HTSR_0980 [Halodesulfurarchaeum formicicum]